MSGRHSETPSYLPVVIALGVTTVTGVCLLIAEGNDESRWSIGAKLLMVLAVSGLILSFGWVVQQAIHRDARHFDDEAQSLGVAPPAGERFHQSALWMLGGLIPFAALGCVLVSDQHLPEYIRMPAFLILPFVGGGLGFFLSPAMRAERDLGRRVAEARGKKEEVEENELAGARATRLKKALDWWTIEQGSHFSDVRFLEDHARVNGPKLIAAKETILTAYNDESDPCATDAGADDLARWALSHQEQLLAERLRDSFDHSPGQLIDILRAHHDRDVMVLTVALPAFFARAVKASAPLREENFEEHARRLLQETDAIIVATATLEDEIGAAASKLAPDRRDDYVSLQSRALRVLQRGEIRRRILAAP